MDSTNYVYILKLQGDNYYVGFTTNIEQRLEQHFNLEGSQWTKMHEPLELIDCFEGTLEDEKNTTLEMMKKYGLKVRGSYWCQLNMKYLPKCLDPPKFSDD